MSKKRKKKVVRTIYPSPGALPPRLLGEYAGCRLVFSDASRQHHGGLAAVLFADNEGEPQVATRRVAPVGSNELELLAAIFALAEADKCFAGEPLALFSDNQPAIQRLSHAWAGGIADDDELATLLASHSLVIAGVNAAFRWVPGHGTCRGNLLADFHARAAAVPAPLA